MPATNPNTNPFEIAERILPGVTCRQIAMLSRIAADPGGSLKRYALHGPTLYTSIFRSMDRLVSLGLISRVRSVDDGREVVLTVTPKGHRFLADLAGVVALARRAA